MRVATWNVLHGMHISGSEVGTPSLAGISQLQHLNLDLLALQEIDRGQPRSHQQHLTLEAAEKAGMPYWYFVPAIIGTPGEQWHEAADHHIDSHEKDQTVSNEDFEPHYGVSLLSKYPLFDLEILRFKPARVGMPLVMPNGKFMYIRDEPRVAILARIKCPTGNLHVATSHLSFVPGTNAIALRRLAKRLRSRSKDEPALIFGDLNLPGSIPARLTKMDSLAMLKTFPNGNPKIQFDHILATNLGKDEVAFSQNKAESIAMNTSDHQLLLTELGS